MTAWPEWDAKVYWPTGPGVALDRNTGREAYYGPKGEPGTPDENAANGAWGTGMFGGWTQPDGRVVFYSPLSGILEALLAGIGAPVSLGNGAAMTYWAQSEGVPDHAYNPCATLRTGYGEHYESPYTAPFYPNMFAGQRAWVDTLTGLSVYAPILTAFREGANLTQIFQAINVSPWCGGCQNGRYPAAMWAALSANPNPPPAGPLPTQTPPPSSGGSGSGGSQFPTSGPPDTEAAWNEVRVVTTETLPVATQMLQDIATITIP